MASISFQQLRVVEDQLKQILEAIQNLELWNKDVLSIDDLLCSPEGMKTLAADCMLIEAIGEGIKRLDERTNGQLLPLRPEIPWQAVKGMRNRIAHGYFDINTDHVWDVLTNDLKPLRKAVEYFLEHLYEVIELDTP